MALTRVPDDQVAAVVTSLEMRERPTPRPTPPSPLRLNRWRKPSANAYRTLFRRVGEPWLWFSRLVMEDRTLIAIIHDERVWVHAVENLQGVEVGLLELDFREPGTCELGFFGLVPEFSGQGHGGWLMSHALALAWAPGVQRVWVHTCTLDHPSALGFYRKWGFVPFARSLETFPDPRVFGTLAPGAGHHIPLLSASRR